MGGRVGWARQQVQRQRHQQVCCISGIKGMPEGRGWEGELEADMGGLGVRTLSFHFWD